MSEQIPAPKAVKDQLHETRVTSGACPSSRAYQAQCDTTGCGWASGIYDENFATGSRWYLAELAANEHQRAVANWPGTTTPGQSDG
jgi:hypothetical protein